MTEGSDMARHHSAAIFALSLAIAVCAAGPCAASDVESTVVAADTARNDTGDWGTITIYFEGETRGVRDSFAATVTLNPGSEIHPPHAHAEEEYLLITEGNGTWVLDGKSFPAKPGDMLYASPWSHHGLRNGPQGPMKFVVWKFSAKGIPVPPAPMAAQR
jgi:mannose-6-phosphate isomerase-like protein (cupin superfamily)